MNVVMGNASRQTKESAEPAFFGFAESFQIVPTFSTADNGCDGHEQNILQKMDFGTFNTRVGQFTEKDNGLVILRSYFQRYHIMRPLQKSISNPNHKIADAIISKFDSRHSAVRIVFAEVS